MRDLCWYRTSFPNQGFFFRSGFEFLVRVKSFEKTSFLRNMHAFVKFILDLDLYVLKDSR